MSVPNGSTDADWFTDLSKVKQPSDSSSAEADARSRSSRPGAAVRGRRLWGRL